MDLLRSIIKDLENNHIADFVEEILPYTSDFETELVPTLNEVEMEELGLLHPDKSTILERFRNQ